MVEELSNLLGNTEILDALREVSVKSSSSHLSSGLTQSERIDWSNLSGDDLDWLKLLSYSLDLPFTKNDHKPVEAYCVDVSAFEITQGEAFN